MRAPRAGEPIGAVDPIALSDLLSPTSYHLFMATFTADDVERSRYSNKALRRGTTDARSANQDRAGSQADRKGTREARARGAPRMFTMQSLGREAYQPDMTQPQIRPAGIGTEYRDTAAQALSWGDRPTTPDGMKK